MSTSPSSSEPARPAGPAGGPPAALQPLPQAVLAAMERALADSLERWHRTPSGGTQPCELDLAEAARAALRAIAPLLAQPQPAGGPDADEPRANLRRRVEGLEGLAEVVRTADVWDPAVYAERPDGRWLAIDRDHYDRIVRALAQVDTWRPWQRPLDRRLGGEV